MQNEAEALRFFLKKYPFKFVSSIYGQGMMPLGSFMFLAELTNPLVQVGTIDAVATDT